MTSSELMLTLRPVDSSSAAIAAAIGRAQTALANVKRDLTGAPTEHDRDLLDAAPSRLGELMRKFEKTREELAGQRDRISAVLAQLEDRLIAAKRDEAEDLLATKREKAEAAGLAKVEIWRTIREQLAPLLREMERLDTAYADAQREFASAAASVSRSYPEMDISLAKSTGNPAIGWRDEVNAMGRPLPTPRVRVPDPEGDALREEREERRRIGTEQYVPHSQRPNSSATPALYRAN